MLKILHFMKARRLRGYQLEDLGKIMSEVMRIPELINSVDELLSLPDVVIRANELIDSEAADIDDIAEVIALDPALSAQLLKLVNSAFYSFPSKIETISRAIMVTGVNELRSLIMSASAVAVFNRIAPDIIDMDDFWFRSVYVGLAAKQISGDRRKAEKMFLMGLLHDVGRIVLFNRDVDSANRILAEVQTSSKKLYEIERDVLGYTISEVSAALLENWGLAESLWHPIQAMFSDEPTADIANDARILQLAARLADCTDPDQKTTNEEFRALQQATGLLEDAHVKPEDLEEIMTEVNLYCFEVLSVINPDASLVF